MKQLSWNDKHDRWPPSVPQNAEHSRDLTAIQWPCLVVAGTPEHMRRSVVISGGFSLRVGRCRSTLWLQMVWSFVDLRAKSFVEKICNLMIPSENLPF